MSATDSSTKRAAACDASPTESPQAAAPNTHCLRLSTILIELSESHGPADAPKSDDEPRLQAADAVSRASKSDLSVGEIIDRTAHAGFGFMIAFLALMSLPAVGASTPFGLAIAFGALQMMVGHHRPWLPGFVRRYQVSLRTLGWIGGKLARWSRGFEKVIRPRFVIFTQGPFWSLCAACILLHAVALALPLPIPGTNGIFAIPILAYAIGLLELDGLLIMLCHAVTAVYIALGISFWKMVVEALEKSVGWLMAILG